MSKEFITLGSIDIEKQKTYCHKGSISIYDVNIDAIVVSNKVPFTKKSFKYFIGNKDCYDDVIPLCIKLLKMTAYRKDFYEPKYMSFFTKETELLEKYNEI